MSIRKRLDFLSTELIFGLTKDLQDFLPAVQDYFLAEFLNLWSSSHRPFGIFLKAKMLI